MFNSNLLNSHPLPIQSIHCQFARFRPFNSLHELPTQSIHCQFARFLPFNSHLLSYHHSGSTALPPWQHRWANRGGCPGRASHRTPTDHRPVAKTTLYGAAARCFGATSSRFRPSGANQCLGKHLRHFFPTNFNKHPTNTNKHLTNSQQTVVKQQQTRQTRIIKKIVHIVFYYKYVFAVFVAVLPLFVGCLLGVCWCLLEVCCGLLEKSAQNVFLCIN